MKYRIAASVLAALVLFSCSKTKPPTDGALSVNGEWVRKTDVERVAQMMREEITRFSPESALQSMSDELRKGAAHQLAANVLMSQEAVKRKITFPDPVFDTMYNKLKKQVGTEATFISMLTQNGQSEDEFKDQFRKGLVVDSLVRYLQSTVLPVTDAECQAFYTQNAEKFRESEMVRASQIFLPLKPDMKSEEKASLLAKMQKIATEAKVNKDFAGLAKKYSKDPSASSGGDIGWFKRGDMRPAIDAAIFSLADGQVSDVVESEIGFHIFKRTDIKMAPPKQFADVASIIRRNLDMKKQSDVITTLVDSLMTSAKIVYADTTLKPSPAPIGVPGLPVK
jgi:parvulin-like peptidyl-prolyl isomerase